MRVLCFALLVAVGCNQAAALESIIVVGPAWEGLNATERATLQARYLVDVRQGQDFGIIIDNQGIDESTPATNGGAVLGGALAQTTYIDRAFRGGSYSATTQLGVGLLGAVLGSSLDKGSVRQFHFRYAVRLRNGDIVYRDSVQPSAFRHPAGVCLALGDLTPAPQAMCSQSADSVRREYLAAAELQPTPQVTAASMTAPPMSAASNGGISCKLANIPPFTTSLEKCNSIGGIQQ